MRPPIGKSLKNGSFSETFMASAQITPEHCGIGDFKHSSTYLSHGHSTSFAPSNHSNPKISLKGFIPIVDGPFFCPF
jgi:hypothetical protein